jgi:hypothetical protein
MQVKVQLASLRSASRCAEHKREYEAAFALLSMGGYEKEVEIFCITKMILFPGEGGI